MTKAENELKKLTGLALVKSEVESLKALQLIALERKRENLVSPQVSFHCVFCGPPGTGKTTVAKIFGAILYGCGVLPKNNTVLSARADLVGEFVGETAGKTRKVFMEARGGVLFIDEAYSLMGNRNDFGAEAVSELLRLMEEHRDDTVVILAGYERDMDKLLDSNEGLRSRFVRSFVFESYNSKELMNIFMELCRGYGDVLHDDAVQEMQVACELLPNTVGFANARSMRRLHEIMTARRAVRIQRSRDGHGAISRERLVNFEASDVSEAMKQFRPEA